MNKEVITAFLDTYKLNNRSKETIKTYDIVLKKFMDCVKKDAAELTLRDVDTFKLFMNDKQYSYATISQHLMCVKSFISFLSDYGYINENFSNLIKLPKKPKTIREPEWLSIENQQKFLDYLSTLGDSKTDMTHKVMLPLYLLTGVRKNELLNVKIEDVDFNTGLILIHGKGNKERYVPIPDLVKKDFELYVNKYTLKLKYNFVFSSNGGKLSDSTINKILERRLQEASIEPIKVHGLRHSCATALFESGASKEEVQMALGHESIKTTEAIYLHPSTARQLSAFSKNILTNRGK